MDVKGEFRIPAPRGAVWQGLNDPEVLRLCIPGCKEIARTSDTEYTAEVVVKVGPVKAPFRGTLVLSDIDAPGGCTIAGEGQGGVAGFARGQAVVRLVENGGATLLSYTAEASVGGKLAQVGQRLLDSTARKLADDFFGKFTEQLSAPATEAAPAAATPVAETPAAPQAIRETRGMRPWIWVAGVIIAVIALLAAFQI